jgi:lipopolysaccharide transport system ATP-binding protein
MSGVIKFDNVSKKYFINQGVSRSLKELVPRMFKRPSLAKQTLLDKTEIWALRNMNFEIPRGESWGIIGPNGSGKTTLLKLLSRITYPTEGKIEVSGTIGNLIELGAGFHPELTGAENIYLNGSILGLTRKEIQEKFKQIVAFAELERFINTPVKKYSSGMYIRLGFSVAAHIEPEILLIDEVLSIGDLSFQRKCLNRIRELSKKATTILFVSHNLLSVQALCSTTIYLSQGKVRYLGDTQEAIQFYEEDTNLKDFSRMIEGTSPGERGFSRNEMEIGEVKTLDIHGEEKKIFRSGEQLIVEIGYHTFKPIPDPVFRVRVVRGDGLTCCEYHTRHDGYSIPLLDGKGIVRLETGTLKLLPQFYSLDISVWDLQSNLRYCRQVRKIIKIEKDLLREFEGEGIYKVEGSWSLLPSV